MNRPREKSGLLRPTTEGSVMTSLDSSDAAIFETFVNPRYLRYFAELMVDMLSPPARAGDAIVAHLSCRTGYPMRQIVQKLGPTRLVGADPSPAALELAKTKSGALSNLSADYRLFRGFPSPLPDASFSHAFAMHPPGGAQNRMRFIQDAARVLVPGGQLLVGTPMQGSFIELLDLAREYAVKADIAKLAEAIDRLAVLRPTSESLTKEFTALGFVDVDFDYHTIAIPFQNGREFLDDPATRLMIMPELRASLASMDSIIPTTLTYVQDSIDKYWAEGGFEVSVVVGCVRGYRG
jgi:SAM-dependent methyltransferase